MTSHSELNDDFQKPPRSCWKSCSCFVDGSVDWSASPAEASPDIAGQKRVPPDHSVYQASSLCLDD